MQQFSSISVSSYEAGALADRLTEQAGDGWSVVAIVPTGSTITAYLGRDGDGASDHGDHGSSGPAMDDHSSIPATTSGTVTGHDTAAAEPVTEAPGWAAGAGATGGDDTVGATPHAESTPTTSMAGDGAAAPAGWYADPSSRFELRYWDGGQWTEHVSRSGQQYTDPPVA